MKSSEDFTTEKFNKEELIGKRFGKLVVLSYNPERSKTLKASVWNCKCDCGNTVTVERKKLLNGTRTDCLNCIEQLCKPGTRFGKLTVIEKDEAVSRARQQYILKCKCDCGKECYITRTDLLNGVRSSCPDCVKLSKHEDVTGKRFGNLVAVCLDENRTKIAQKAIWKCVCDCGNTTYSSLSNLKGGISTSCGCKRKVTIQAKCKVPMIGKKFGSLTVIAENKEASKKKYNNNGFIESTIPYYDCKCDCGGFVTVAGSALRSGNTTTCGHCYKGEDLTGKRFGKLTVIELDHFGKAYKNAKTNSAFWRCKCDCGNEVLVPTTRLKTGNTTSCGCQIQNELESRGTFGIYYEELRSKYQAMVSRCTNPNNEYYQWYGGRGIKICDRWLDNSSGLQNFYYDMIEGYEPGLTIDRKDVNGDYSPENCRWMDRKGQQYNKRSNVYVDYYGKKICLAELAEKFSPYTGIDSSKISHRLNEGYTIDEALNKPLYTAQKKENYFKNNPIKTRPFMYQSELDAMNLYADDMEYNKIPKDEMQAFVESLPKFGDYNWKDIDPNTGLSID